MRYAQVICGKFISRPNRFIAHVEIDGQIEVVHVKNTGRCGELLAFGATVYLSVSDNEKRKTKYDLIAVEKITGRGTILINMDSQVVNDVAHEHLCRVFPKGKIKREVTFGNSRFDFYIEEDGRQIFCEAKGVTLEQDGVVSFPDAPTVRGIKHLNELVRAMDCGYEAYVLFIIQMNGVKYFTPNDTRHKAFGDALRNASLQGVKILAVDSLVTPNSIIPNEEVAVIL